jgi:hypothetical protein
MTLTYPDNTFQFYVEPWWVKDEEKDCSRGRLIQAFLPHVDQIPYQVIPIGRSEAALHDRAQFEISPLSVNQPKPRIKLPVAGMPVYDHEVLTAHRSKLRPALVLSTGGLAVEKAVRQGKPSWQTAPTILVAPYYGADEGGKRSGFSVRFRERICRGLYPQFVWERLPLASGTAESILRLDHIQPVGQHYTSIRISEYKLSQDALEIVDEWLHWMMWGTFDPQSNFSFLREGLKNIDSLF